MEDETLYPIVMRIINTMVFDNKIPIDFIKSKIKTVCFPKILFV